MVDEKKVFRADCDAIKDRKIHFIALDDFLSVWITDKGNVQGIATITKEEAKKLNDFIKTQVGPWL